MSRVICCRSALRFFGMFVRTIDIVNFYDFIDKLLEFLVLFSGNRSEYSLVPQGLLLATSYPSGNENQKSLPASGNDNRHDDIDSSKTLEYINEQIEKIRDILSSVESGPRSAMFPALEKIMAGVTGIQEAITARYDHMDTDEGFGDAACQTDDVFLQQLRSVILHNLADIELDVDRLSELMNMSRRNLFRRIKSVAGLTPAELINKIRLRMARKMLQDSDMRVYEIADRVGFKSRIVFTRNFTKFYSVSPTGFLKKNKHR